MKVYAFLRLWLWGWVSDTYREASFGFLYTVLDDKRLPMTFQTIPNRLVVSEANLNRNLSKRNPKDAMLFN